MEKKRTRKKARVSAATRKISGEAPKSKAKQSKVGRPKGEAAKKKEAAKAAEAKNFTSILSFLKPKDPQPPQPPPVT